MNANGNFVFNTALPDATQLQRYRSDSTGGQSCAPRNNTGTIAGSNVSTVEVICASNQFAVGGTVSGLTGKGLVLQLNGANDVSITKDGAFSFPVTLARNTPYNVKVKDQSQPSTPTQECTVANGSGTITNANVENVSVTCTTKSFSVGGQVSRLQGSGLVLLLNGANDLPISANGNFAFPPVLSGTGYTVTVKADSQPRTPNQTCTFANEKGTVGAGPVTNIQVTCATTTYTVGGSVAGLQGSGLRLMLNQSETLVIPGNGRFTFPRALADGTPYVVQVLDPQPTNPARARHAQSSNRQTAEPGAEATSQTSS